MPDQAVGTEVGHRTERLLDRDSWVGPVDQQQVDGVEPQAVQTRPGRAPDIVGAEVRPPHLGRHEHVVPVDRRRRDGVPDGCLVLVVLGRVDVAIPQVQCRPNGLTAFPLVHLKRSQPERRNRGVAGGDVFHTPATAGSEEYVTPSPESGSQGRSVTV